MFCGNSQAAPSGQDLLLACENSLLNGFQGTKGMMCIWYVTPCDCHYGEKESIPRVCLPVDISHEELAKEVVSGLKADPALQEFTAEMAVGTILSPHYPCD